MHTVVLMSAHTVVLMSAHTVVLMSAHTAVLQHMQEMLGLRASGDVDYVAFLQALDEMVSSEVAPGNRVRSFWSRIGSFTGLWVAQIAASDACVDTGATSLLEGQWRDLRFLVLV